MSREATIWELKASGLISEADATSLEDTPSDRMVHPLFYDAGTPARATLGVAADVVSATTVTIGADVYEVEIVNTDTTDDTLLLDFTNTTDPLTLTQAKAVLYANCLSWPVGRLFRIENEILRVSVNDATGVTFLRGQSGTTTASHIAGKHILRGDGIAAGSTIAVGLVATLTPTAFIPALVDDINNRGTENVKATAIGITDILIQTALSPGGTVCASAAVTALAETLAGGSNEWDTAALRDGHLPGQRKMAMVSHLVDDLEAALGVVRLCFPFTVGGFLLQVYDANGLFLEGLTDQFVKSTTYVICDGTGGTNPAAGETVHCIAWE